MNKIKTYSLSALALTGMFLIGSLTRSRDSQAKGAYSTPVTVMNTSNEPVPAQDAEKLARIPYQSHVSGSGGCSLGTDPCSQPAFTSPPPGYRLVVENISGNFKADIANPGGGVTGYLEQTGGSANNFVLFFSAPLEAPEPGGHAHAAFTQPARAYVDPSPGSVLSAWLFEPWVAGDMVLTGYLENCAVTGCPPVQH